MSAPVSSLPPGPSAAGTTARTSAGGAPEAFGSALEDALAGTSTATPRTSGDAPDDVAGQAADAPATNAEDVDDAPTVPAAELPPGLWALLAGVVAPAPSPTPATSAGSGDLQIMTGAVAGVAAVPGALPGAAAARAVAPQLVAGQVVAGQAPGTADPTGTAPAGAAPTVPAAPAAPADRVRGAAADALARAVELTVVAAPAGSAGAAPLPPTVGGPGATVPAPGTPVPVPAGTGASGADGSGAGSGSDSGTGLPAAETAPTAPDAPTTGIAGAAPSTGPAATPSAAAAPVARETPVAAQLAPQLAVLRNAPDGAQTMTVVLTPDALGEVTVQVTITDGTLDLMLRGGSEHGRHALTDALPELRRELESAGLSFSRLAVDPDAPRDGGGSRTAEQLLADLRGNGGQQGQTPHRSRGWTTTDTSPGEGSAPAARPSASSGVDIRV